MIGPLLELPVDVATDAAEASGQVAGAFLDAAMPTVTLEVEHGG